MAADVVERTLAEAVRVLQVRTAAAVGHDYFGALARGFAEAFGMRFGFLGRLAAGCDAVEVLAFWTGDEFGPRFTYALDGTPCARLACGAEACQLAERALDRFPRDGFFVRHAIESYIGVPIRGPDGAVLGLLAACDPRPRAAIPALADAVRAFADRAAWLFEREAYEAALQREVARAQGLARIAGLLQTTDVPASSFDAVCEEIRAVIGADGVALRLLDAAGEGFAIRGQAGLPPAFQAFAPVPVGEVEPAVHSGEVVVELPRERLAALRNAELVLADGVQSVLIGIARHEGRVVGLILAYTRAHGRGWAPEARAWLAGVAGLLSQALANARLVDALRTSEARFRQIVTAGLEGVLTTDAELRIAFANQQAGEMLGVSPQELLGRPVHEVLAPAPDGARQPTLVGGARQRFEAPLRRADGQPRWAVVSSSPLPDAHEGFAGATVLLSDVTEMRALADKVAHLQKLESLGVLAGGIAHDFNNLLVAVVGNVDLALQRLPPPSQARQFLAEVQIAAQRATELTRQMLAYSGRSRLHLQRIELGRLVDELRPSLRRLAGPAASLVVTTTPGAWIEADADQLRQVITSLVLNASEALSERGGTIAIAVAAQELDAAALARCYLGEGLAEGSYAVLSVTDDGCGMDAATRARIFDPFFTTKFTGRGLGLAAALGILRGHRGAIAVESAPGRGSAFRVVLPRARDEVAAPPREPARRGASKVLVVDDDPLVLTVGRRVLERAGLEVVAASSGAAAIERFAADGEQIGAVLLDMTMPGLSGEQTFRALRKIRPDVAVVLTSGYDEREATARIGGQTIAGFVQKPWPPDELVQAVRRALGVDR